MKTVREIAKKSYQAALRLAWFLGGQKEHKYSGFVVPPCSFVSNEASLIFPAEIRLGENALLLCGAKLICSGMPPYLQPAGSIEIGDETIIREGAILHTYGGRIKIGTRSAVNPYCVLQGNGGITIGDGTMLAANVLIFSANHVFADPDRRIQVQGETALGVAIGDDCWIGAGSVILDGVTIGNGSIVAAGSVVNRNVPEKSVVAGVPAKIVKKRG